MHYIPLLSTPVTIAFALAVFNRYRYKKGAHLLLWGVGLVFFALGVLGEAIMLFTFNPWVLKIWYLSGAMLTAAWLGQGTVHLLVRKRGLASSLTSGLAVVSLIAAVLVLVAPVTPAAALYDVNIPASAQYHDILVRSPLTVLLTILLNVYGSVALIGGAVYSAFLFWRKQVLAHRVVGNILIAAGAFLPAMGGTFIKIGLSDWLYLSEFLGALIMFTGFIVATSSQKAKVKAGAPSSTAV